MAQAEQQIGASWQEVSGTAALVPLGALACLLAAPKRSNSAVVPALELVLVVLPSALIWQPSFHTVVGLAAAAMTLAAIQAAPATRQRSTQQQQTAWLSSWSSGHLRCVCTCMLGLHVGPSIPCVRWYSRPMDLSQPGLAGMSAGSEGV